MPCHLALHVLRMCCVSSWLTHLLLCERTLVKLDSSTP